MDALQIAIKLIYVEQDKTNVMLNTRITKGKEIQRKKHAFATVTCKFQVQ